ncbi:MAG TPA: metalloregulator ArsR/SmtB family transcription factor [Candidatus Microsaccharimonas sp.]|jgi:DNA-binding transcriptional ArsR family regulator
MDELKKIRKIFTGSLPIFSALGDENRQKLILLMLEPEPKSVKELTDGTQLSRPSISHHLKILKDAGLIEETKKGTRTYYHPRTGEHVNNMKILLEEIERLETLKEGGK